MPEIALDLLWNRCLENLKTHLSEQDFYTWISPLQVHYFNNELFLLAPNQFVLQCIHNRFLSDIQNFCSTLSTQSVKVVLQVGSAQVESEVKEGSNTKIPNIEENRISPELKSFPFYGSNQLNQKFSFQNFVEGSSNQLALAAALHVSQNFGKTYNPFVLYGGSGLGKTHLMHAIGNHIHQKNPKVRVMYLNSERFVSDMVKALRTDSINQLKEGYRSVDVFCMDDIQFLAGKDRSQEEFFHTINTLLEGQQQIVLTCDRYPKEISGVEERLKSRLGCGLTVIIEPPDLETRVAILLKKAMQAQVKLPQEVAFFIAKRIRSNVRELEGVLKRITAYAQFTGCTITLELVREAIKDILALQDKLVTIEGIIKTVAEYYKIRVSDLLSKRRTASLVKARQIAMALAKELTNHSLPEIGREFGGRDHTTVLYAARKIQEEKLIKTSILEDFTNLFRILSSG